MIMINVVSESDEDSVRLATFYQVPAVGEYVSVAGNNYKVTAVHHHPEDDRGIFATIYVEE